MKMGLRFSFWTTLLMMMTQGAFCQLTWTGADPSGYWSAPANWSPPGVPVNGADLVFPGGLPAGDMVSTNDLTDSFFRSINSGNAEGRGSDRFLLSTGTLARLLSAVRSVQKHGLTPGDSPGSRRRGTDGHGFLIQRKDAILLRNQATEDREPQQFRRQGFDPTSQCAVIPKDSGQVEGRGRKRDAHLLRVKKV